MRIQYASAWRIAIAILLPFRRTFRRLELEKRWWHRLCLVTFFVALSTIFAAVAWLSYSMIAPKTSSEPLIWVTVNPASTGMPDKWDEYSTPFPSDAQIGRAIIPGEKSVEMPDGKTVNFPGSMSDDAIKAQWANAKLHQILTAISRASLLAILSVLIISYEVQAAYRALLYVVFGSKPVTASDPTAD